MKGSQLTVYANQSHHVAGRAVCEWLLALIRIHGIQGATVIAAREAIDTHGRLHAARFFELADVPLAITVAAEDAAIDGLLAELDASGAQLFYTRFPVEYGELGAA